jgi:acyl-CoA thioesterase
VTTKGLPFQGSEVPELGGWMRFDVAPDTVTKSHLVCLIDSFPPAPMTYYDRVVPLSTVNWGIHFAEPLDGVSGEDFLGYLARVNFLKDGYGSSAADIWAPDGRLLAKSYQTFVIYG